MSKIYLIGLITGLVYIIFWYSIHQFRAFH